MRRFRDDDGKDDDGKQRDATGKASGAFLGFFFQGVPRKGRDKRSEGRSGVTGVTGVTGVAGVTAAEAVSDGLFGVSPGLE